MQHLEATICGGPMSCCSHVSLHSYFHEPAWWRYALQLCVGNCPDQFTDLMKRSFLQSGRQGFLCAGVIICEGAEEDAAEFVHRLRQLRWKVKLWLQFSVNRVHIQSWTALIVTCQCQKVLELGMHNVQHQAGFLPDTYTEHINALQ